MKKISTLFKKNPENLGRVINEINPENEWVFKGEGTATQKFDGTAAAIINGELYKRYDVKKGRSIPVNAIECQGPDEVTGHHPHWVKCDPSNPEDRYFIEAWDKRSDKEDGTFELVGPKVQGNPERLAYHILIRHDCKSLDIPDLSFDGIRKYLEEKDIEGIVFHHPDGRMCKIRKKDFGIKR